MKNKILTFNNLLAVLGLVAILLFLCPAFVFNSPGGTPENVYPNLFTIVFGGSVSPAGVSNAYLVFNTPLFFAFLFIIFGMACNILSNSRKWINFIGFTFYAASGILFLCSEPIVKHVNLNVGIGTVTRIYWYGGVVAVGVVLCSIAFITLIAAIIGSSKPRTQETY